MLSDKFIIFENFFYDDIDTKYRLFLSNLTNLSKVIFSDNFFIFPYVFRPQLLNKIIHIYNEFITIFFPSVTNIFSLYH